LRTGSVVAALRLADMTNPHPRLHLPRACSEILSKHLARAGERDLSLTAARAARIADRNPAWDSQRMRRSRAQGELQFQQAPSIADCRSWPLPGTRTIRPIRRLRGVHAGGERAYQDFVADLRQLKKRNDAL
jgi:hypothetical protein